MVIDTIVNFESRFDKMQEMSEGYITIIREEYKVPHPLDKLAFVTLTLIMLYVSKKFMSLVFGGRRQQPYKFNSPDYSEIGTLMTNVKRL